jgi:hypothetical protein
MLLLAIANGGIGIKHSKNAVSGEKGFGVVAGVFGTAYIGVLVWAYVTVGRQAPDRKSEEYVAMGPFGEKEAILG